MGSRITRAAAHLSEKEVQARMQREQRPWCRRRWEIIYQAQRDPRKAEDIAKTVGDFNLQAQRSGSYRDAWERRAASPVPHAGTRTRLPPAVLSSCLSGRDGDSSRDKARV
jgi:hypothetical protein